MNKVKIEDIKALLPELKDEDVNKLQLLFDRNFLSIVNGIESDIFDITRIQKNGSEKYHEYLKRAFGDYILANTNKSELENLTNEVKTLKAEKTQLEEKIKSGQTGKTKEDLDKLELALKLKDDKINELQGQMSKAQEQFNTEKTDLMKNYNGNLRSLMINQVKDKYKIENTAITEQLKTVIYRDIESNLSGFELKVENDKTVLYKDGQLQYSAKNPLEVLTLDSFYKEQLEPYGAISITAIPGQAGKTGTGIIAGAKTKSEAGKMINDHLVKSGIDKNNENYNTEYTKIAKETGAFELPETI